MKRLAALLLLAAGIAVFAIGEPGIDHITNRESARLDARLASRDVHIDAAELLALMYNRQLQLVIVDVRDEAGYNLFHLAGARRFSGDDDGVRRIRGLDPGAVKVIVDDGERRADRVWKRAAALGTQNLYVLGGGIDGWLALYHRSTPGGATFRAAVGARHAASAPPADWLSDREFVEKVKVVKPVAGPAGGCGG